MDPRWTQDTHDLVADELIGYVWSHDGRAGVVEKILGVLADAGLLVDLHPVIELVVPQMGDGEPPVDGDPTPG